MKILFHIDEEDKWNMVLENVKNMLAYKKENSLDFEIEVVANGNAAVGLLEPVAKESGWYIELEEFSKAGVAMFACNNSLNKFNQEGRPLCSFAGVVPAGVVEIAAKQMEGFAYIKP